MSTSNAPHDVESIMYKQCNGNIARRETDKGIALEKLADANGICTSNSNKKSVTELLLGEGNKERAVHDGGSWPKTVEINPEKLENVTGGDAVIDISDELASAVKITDEIVNSEKNKKLGAIAEFESKGHVEGDNSKPDKTDSATSEIQDALGVTYLKYENEHQMEPIMQLITKDLSEPYSIYTYRYFIHNWPQLCFLAHYESKYVGAIVCKLDLHKKIIRRGYIAMLAVDQSVRRKNIGTSLVKTAIEAMDKEGCDEVVLETEVTNKPALKLYENLGFVRDKRLFRYYLNGVDALRLKLWLR